MKAALVVMFVLGIAWACSGCALVAAGVVGGVIVHNCEVYGDCYLMRRPHPHYRPCLNCGNHR